MRALVLGLETRMVLPVVRSLGRRGVEVHLGWYPDDGSAARSRYVHRRHRLPAYAPASSDWRHRLRALLESTGFDVVMPVCESSTLAVHSARRELAPSARLALPGGEAWSIVSDKERTEALARSLGVPVPASTAVDAGLTPPEVQRLLERQPLPTIVKPTQTVRRSDEPTKNFVHVSRTREDLFEYVAHMRRHGARVLLQEVVPGRGVGVEFLARNGDLSVVFAHRRLHDTSGFGSTYRESMAPPADLVDATATMVRALGYHGVGMAEFRVDDASGRWALLEINGRFWGSLPLAVRAGADFPWFLYQLLTEDRRDFPTSFEVGVRSRDLALDLRWVWRSLRERLRGRPSARDAWVGWEVNPRPASELAADLARFLTLRDGTDSFARDDIRPWLAELRALADVAVRPRRTLGWRAAD